MFLNVMDNYQALKKVIILHGIVLISRPKSLNIEINSVHSADINAVVNGALSVLNFMKS